METEATLNRASAGAHAAVDSVAGAADAVASKAKPTIDRAAAMAHQAVDRAAAAAGPAAAWVSAQGQDLAAMEKKVVNDTCAYISANPLKSIGIALAAGFVLSRLLRS